MIQPGRARQLREITAELREEASKLYRRSVERGGLPSDCREVVTAEEAALLALTLWGAAEAIEIVVPTPLRPVRRPTWVRRLLGRLAAALKAADA